MSPRGLLVTLPLDSIALRAVVASLVAVLVARLLLRASIRLPRVRVLAALLPVIAIVGVLVLDAGRMNLPTLMLPVDGGHELSVPVAGGYLHFASAAVPILVGTWLLIATWRIVRRLRGHVLAVRAAHRAIDAQSEAPAHRVRRMTTRVARRLGVPPPDVAVSEAVAGGAAIIGIRRPVLLLDEQLVRRLDNAELRGVISHELAHVARRDNLLAFTTGIIGDLAFFVPGRRWTLQRLCAEREFAADQLALVATRRPGALASGLLKAIQRAEPAPLGAAALVDGVTVVRRVEQLIDPAPAPTKLRGGAERLAVGVAVALVLAGASVVPGLVGGSEDTDGFAVMWRSADAAPAVTTTSEARAFDVYRDVALTRTPTPRSIQFFDDEPWDFHPGAIRACAEHDSCTVSSPNRTLGLRPRPRVRVDDALTQRWTARELLANDGGVSVYRITRAD